MRPWLLQLLCLLGLVACATLAHAQTRTPIYRCIGTHGEPVFSGRPCGSPLAVPGVGTATTAEGSGFGAVCAASPQALRQAIATAFESHDVNRLAGLILWRGVDPASARARLRSLAEWLKQPLAGIAITYAAGPPFADAAPAPAVPAGATSAAVVASRPGGFEISTGGGDGNTRAFGITEFGGCWWLTFD